MNHHDSQRKRIGTLPTMIAAMLVAAALSGCPSFTIDNIGLVDGTVTTKSFTVSGTVNVVEDDPAVDDNGGLSGGRGVLGVWLPPGWEAQGARAIEPQAEGPVNLVPIEDGDGLLPPTFPRVPGTWYAFVSNCENIKEGAFAYEVEIDVEGDGTETSLVMGISTTQFNKDGSRGPTPREIAVDLVEGSAVMTALPTQPKPAVLVECESIPYEDPQAGDGCGCSTTGTPARGLWQGLLNLFLG